MISKFSWKLRPRWLAAYINDVMNNPYANTLFLYESTANAEVIGALPTYGQLENLMFSISGDAASGGPVLVSSSSLFGRVKAICPSFPEARVSIHLRTSNFGV